MSKSTKAIAYCRIATTHQTDQNLSLEAQKHQIAKAAKKLNIEIIKWFEEIGSGSGRSNTALQQAVEYCIGNKDIQHLLVARPDRISRSIADFYYWESAFYPRGINIIFPDHDTAVQELANMEAREFNIRNGMGIAKTITLNSPTERFMEELMVLIAKYDSELLKERVKAGLRRKKQEGRQG